MGGRQGRAPQAAHDDTRRHARVLDQRQIFLGDLLERRVDLFLAVGQREPGLHARDRSEEHTSEIQALMRNSYADFCLKKKNINTIPINSTTITKQHTNTK